MILTPTARNRFITIRFLQSDSAQSRKFPSSHMTLHDHEVAPRGRGCVRIMSWYSKFIRSHFGLAPSSIHKMTEL